VEFTPELAAQYLGRVNVQRRLKPTTVAGYASDMMAGRWEEDTNAIVLNDDGDLVNGQHRLTAVVQSDCTVGFWVRRGAPLESILRMDQGAPRAGGDQLAILGMTSGHQLHAIARVVLNYRACPGKVWNTPLLTTITKSLVTDEAYTNADTYISANHAIGHWPRIRCNRSVAGALHVLIHQDSNHADGWEEFSTGVVSGAGLGPADPRLALRNFWIRPDRGRGFGARQAELFATIRAWNGYVRDEELKLLRMPRREQLPMPKVL
jgi:hypothetical protein